MTSAVTGLGSCRTRLLPYVGLFVLLALVSSPVAAQNRPIIVQTNSAGDNVHLIDPATNETSSVRSPASRSYMVRRSRPTGVDSISATSRPTPWTSST